MKRPIRLPLLVAVALLATGSVPVAAAHGRVRTPVPLGVTVTAPVSAGDARVGVLVRGGAHYCTASVVHSERRDLVVTAAHCLSGSGGGAIYFVPGYRGGEAPYGEWAVTRTYVGDGWKGREDEDSDVAFARVASRGGEEIEDVVGGNRLVAGRRVSPVGRAVTVVGYPRARETPVWCTNISTAYGGSQQRIECPGYSGGTSGSPWIDAEGRVVGVLGGFQQGGTTDDVSYSVVFGREAAELYGKASK
ncbi:trypsin-like serine peptidase [Streptomyces liliifuscus]|uniref:Trypsin-like peptidase domain-containing protein n=1 Tax=Streptomyces liliifuscus TaxID=2797636 RepID=A0A7T7I6I5_9ACTN|nr:serine protease [Streptomyces liliifuscus]QQM41842.1 trypsin-like peptidase domain-containing protein [Streptomyces liliifuscus]